ncbi:MbtH family protein [Lysinibacillus sp. NPDC059133]|uniref:MbtH family protein n=1 Tax=Lysinibacillus sp. NPDC059133 TaxID=3346737 RepID=UPI00367F8EA4
MDGFIQFQVVVNKEEQYSIWPQELEVPKGWSEVGYKGSKEECLAYIKEHWIDISPKSIRELQP